jgi:CheY-like chemotaxis protein
MDCIILNPSLSGIVASLPREEDEAGVVPGRIPVIFYGDERVDDETWKRLNEICLLRSAHSVNRLMDQLTLCLHHDTSRLPEARQKELQDLYHSNMPLAAKKVLIVDDDARNIFALTSVLEEHQMNILSADSGREAINILQSDPAVDIVLMDIMMPEMDGVETIQEIRKISRLKNLPIVAVTAKAMKGDREKCIEAGAWDYLSKPVDTQQMMTVLRAWLHR